MSARSDNGDCWEYIQDMLSQLAEMALQNGDSRLFNAIAMVAVDCGSPRRIVSNLSAEELIRLAVMVEIGGRVARKIADAGELDRDAIYEVAEQVDNAARRLRGIAEKGASIPN